MLLKEAEEKHKLERELVRSVYQTFWAPHMKHVDDTHTIIPSRLCSQNILNFLQMIKQVSEYKLQVKALREQEMDMRDQVRPTGIMGNMSSSPPPCRNAQCFPLLLRSLTCTPRSLMKSRARYQRVTVSTAASNKTWTKWDCFHRTFEVSIMILVMLFGWSLNKNMIKKNRHKWRIPWGLCKSNIILFLEEAFDSVLHNLTIYFLSCRWQRRWKSWRKSASHGRVALMAVTRVSLTWWQM